MKFFKYIFGFSSIIILLTNCQNKGRQFEAMSTLTHLKCATLSECAPKPTASLHRPFDFPLFLSGNFGELRANHFHSGIDFKTEGTIGKPIHCAEDGYVSKIIVSGSGYGRALFVTHPTCGLTTVYAHIDRFAPKIDSIVRCEQYLRKTFAIELKLKPNYLPINKGEIIAMSGNSGHSFGPHLHMEVRHTISGDAIDPLPYFKKFITDNVAPNAHRLVLYPDPQTGLVNNSKKPCYIDIKAEQAINFSAWGNVYPAIEANDYMSDTHNVYGVKYLTLKVDGKEVYHRAIDRFRFEYTRAINTLIDYNDLNNTNHWYMHTRVPQSKPLGSMIKTSLENGALNITEERCYNCEYILKDEYDNTKHIKFTIQGKRSDAKNRSINGKLIKYTTGDTINLSGLNLKFYTDCFYEDTYISTSLNNSNKYHSHIYCIKNNDIPLARSFRMAIKLNNDTIADKNKYCIVRIKENKQYAIKSQYKNGEIIAYASRLGNYAITTDMLAPKITPINENSWESTGIITYRISDNLSGIKNYYGEIDGKWVMFEHDAKNSLITFHLDSKYVSRNNKHKINITAIDECYNKTQITNKFYW